MIGTRTVNEVIMIGWVANDPITKESNTSQKLVVFNLATRRVWITKEGEKKEEVQYHKMTAWGRLADKAEKILKKGVKVYIRGYLHNRKLQIEGEDKTRIITEVVLNDILVLSKKNEFENDLSGPEDDSDLGDYNSEIEDYQ